MVADLIVTKSFTCSDIQSLTLFKNCWIIGALQTSKKQNILQQVTTKIEETEQSKIQENTYLKTNIELETDDGTSKPSLSAKDYAYKYCIHSVANKTSGTITDYLYFSKRVSGVFDWVKIC